VKNGAAVNVGAAAAAKPANVKNGAAAKPANAATKPANAAAKPANAAANNYTTLSLSQLIALSKKPTLTQNQKGMLDARISSAIEEQLSAIPGYPFSERGLAWRTLRATVPQKHRKHARIVSAIKSEIRLASTGNARVAGERLRAFQRNLKLSHSMFGNLKGNQNINKEFEAVFRRLPKKNGVPSMIGAGAMTEENLRRKRNNENRRIRDEENRRRRRRNDQERRRNEQEERNMYRRSPSSRRRYAEEEFFGGSPTPRASSNYRPIPNSPRMNMSMLPQNQQTAINSIGGPTPAANALMLGGGSNAVALAADAVTQAGGNVEVAKMYNPNIPAAAINAVVNLGGPQNAARVMNGMAAITPTPSPVRKKKKAATTSKGTKKKAATASKGVVKKKAATASKAAPKKNANLPPLPPIPRPEVISMLMKAIPKGKLEKIASVQVFGTTKNNLEAKVKALALGTNKAKRFPEKK
jgi:hypothetical protein